MAVLDTSFLIALDRREPGAQALMTQMQQEGAAVTVPAAVWLEYLVGVAPRVRELAANILSRAAEIVPFDQDLADRAVLLQDELLRSGRRLGWHDLQVAATALHRHDALVTLDQGFDEVAGLASIDLQLQAPGPRTQKRQKSDPPEILVGRRSPR